MADSKSILVCVYVPSKDKKGQLINQLQLVYDLVTYFNTKYGGSTEDAPSKGCWMDGDNLVQESIIKVSCFFTESQFAENKPALFTWLTNFCKKAKQSALCVEINMGETTFISDNMSENGLATKDSKIFKLALAELVAKYPNKTEGELFNLMKNMSGFETVKRPNFSAALTSLTESAPNARKETLFRREKNSNNIWVYSRKVTSWDGL